MANTSVEGKLLLASPDLLDPNFAQTVVLVVQHNEDGALGVVINRPSDTNLNEAWQTIVGEPCELSEPLYHGGPCQGPLMVLHGEPDTSQIQVCDGVHFTSDEDDVTILIEQQCEPSKFFVGYAGWSPLQLDGELETGSWLVVPASRSEIFDFGSDQWDRLVKVALRSHALRGINPKIIPSDPSLN